MQTARRRAPRRRSLPTPRAAADVASLGFVLAAGLQVLLALGIVPITMAWGGTQPALTTPLRLASVAAAALMGLAAVAIRRRAAPRPSARMKVLAWIIAGLLALNTAGNLASSSTGEALLFGPLTAVLTVLCLRVASSRTAHPAGAAPG